MTYRWKLHIDDETTFLLANHRRPILPNLSLLYCTPSIQASWEILLLGIPIFNAPGIPVIEPGPSPRLAHLILDRFSSALSRYPGEFSSLRSLEIVHWAPLSEELCVFPYLRSLVLSHFHASETAGFTLSLPQLRHLHITCGSQALRFMDTLGANGIESIWLPNLGQESKSVAGVVANRWARTLREFSFIARHIHDLDALATCTCLETFSLRDCPTFGIDDFLEIAGKWERLTYLSLPSASGIDLTVLVRMAGIFTRLNFLEVDFGNPTFFPPLSTTPQLLHGLKRLVFHSFPPQGDGDERLLARHLHRLFPRLDSIRYGGRSEERITPEEKGGIDQDLWSQVLVEVFRCQDSPSVH